MNRFIVAIAAGILALALAACSPSVGQAVGGAVLGGIPVAGASGAVVDPTDSAPAESSAGAPDYGAKKPHDHCGNGTMVHLGSVICSP